MTFYFWNGTSTFDCHFLGKYKSSFCSLFCNNITVNILGLHKNLMRNDKDEQKKKPCHSDYCEKYFLLDIVITRI